LVLAIALSIGCGGRENLSADEAGPSGGAAGTSPDDASSGGDDGSVGGSAGSNAGGAGGAAGSGATGGVAGSTGRGGAAGTGTTGGAAGTTGGAAGGTGGSGALPDAGDLPDVSTPQDSGTQPDSVLDTRNLDGCLPVACSTPARTYCGLIGDGCGGALDCGSCPTGYDCGSRMPNVCGLPCPFCSRITRCESGVTQITGTAVTGAATSPDPLYGALVFIPNIAPGGKLPPFTDGPSCNRCAAPLTRDQAFASAVTGPNGTFTLQGDLPTGTGIPLVVQLGHWRYETTIDVVPCVTNHLPAGTARLPRIQTEGNIPLTAVSTGNVDALECILRKMGVADTEFSNPAGAGRIHFYRNNGASYDVSTPNEAALVSTQATWDKYDQILFPCEGSQTSETAQALTSFIDYTSKGGRVLATHFSYTWLYQNGGFATAGTWQPNQQNPINPLIADVDTTHPKGQSFVTWLGLVGALSSVSPPQVSINDPRRNLNAVPAGQGGQRWIYSDTAPPLVQQMVIDTPVAATPDQLCGRVIYSDFHVANAVNDQLTFPAECPTTDLTPQEKILEFMLLDLSSCTSTKGPPPPPPIEPPPPLPPRD
jgi:hypothetical protein